MNTKETTTNCSGCIHGKHVLGRCGQTQPNGMICSCVIGPPPTLIDSLNLEYAIDRWHYRKMNPEDTHAS